MIIVPKCVHHQQDSSASIRQDHYLELSRPPLSDSYKYRSELTDFGAMKRSDRTLCEHQRLRSITRGEEARLNTLRDIFVMPNFSAEGQRSDIQRLPRYLRNGDSDVKHWPRSGLPIVLLTRLIPSWAISRAIIFSIPSVQLHNDLGAKRICEASAVTCLKSERHWHNLRFNARGST